MHDIGIRIGRLVAASLVLLLASGCFSTSVESLRLQKYRPDTGNREVLVVNDPSGTGENPQGKELPPPEVEKGNLIKRGDRVTLHLFTRENSPKIEDIVDDGGEVNLPLIGSIKIGGLTTSQAEQLIEKTYQDEGFYKNIDVSVIKEIEAGTSSVAR